MVENLGSYGVKIFVSISWTILFPDETSLTDAALRYSIRVFLGKIYKKIGIFF